MAQKEEIEKRCFCLHILGKLLSKREEVVTGVFTIMLGKKKLSGSSREENFNSV